MTARSSAASSVHEGFAAQSAMLDAARNIASKAALTPRALLIAFDFENGAADHLLGLHVRVLESAGAVVGTRLVSSEMGQEELNAIIDAANQDESIDGVLLLIPVPPQIDFRESLNRIAPVKDLEGVHPEHAVHLLATSAEAAKGQLVRRPVVVDSFLELFSEAGIVLSDPDLSVAIISDVEIIDTNPLANLMVRAAAPAVFPSTAVLSLVTLANPKAKDIVRHADVVVVSLLRPRYLDRTWFKDGAVILDFAPNAIGVKTLPSGKQVPEICGGVDVESAGPIASKLFPIPAGIGPVMLGTLARNLAESALHRRGATLAPNAHLTSE